MGFQVAVDLTALGPLLGITALQDSREPLADEALFEADDRTTTDLKGLGNLSIGEWLLLATIRFEEHAGHDLLIRAGFPCPDEAGQALTLLVGEGDGISGDTHAFLLA
jgi:hypothetical protein